MNAPLHDAAVEPIARLFSEYGDFVFRTLQYLGVPSAVLDDALQDVFITAHRRWDAFEGRSSPRTWLYGIARRVAFRYRRKHRNRQARFVLTEEPTEGVERPFDRAHARRSVSALLEGLDTDKRAAFVLVEVEGFTAAEAAELLRVPLGTVYSRVRAAWARLRDAAQHEVEVEGLRVSMPRQRRAAVQRMVLAGCAPLAATGTAVAGLGGLSWMWGLLALGAVGIGVVVVGRSEPSPGPPPAVEAPESPSAPPVAAPVESPSNPSVSPSASPEPSVVPAASPARPRPRAAPKPPPKPRSTLTDELRLIRKAKELARDGKASDAEAVLDEHARRFPDGQLVDEREEVRRSLSGAASRSGIPSVTEP